MKKGPTGPFSILTVVWFQIAGMMPKARMPCVRAR